MADLRSYVIGLAATADNLAAPSNDVSFVGTFGFVFDGANWDRIRGDATDGLLVNLGSNNDVAATSVIPGTGATNLGKAVDSAAGGTDTGVAPLAVRDDALSSLTPIEGDYVPLRTDANGALWVIPSGTVTVDLSTNNDVTVTSGNITADTELPTAASLADATANPTVPAVGGFLMGFNGTTWDRVRTANTGRLQVDVITGGGSDTPTNPANHYVTSSALAAGSSANLDTSDLGAKKLSQVEVWSSVAYKAAVYKVENGTPSTDPIAIGGGAAHGGWTWKVPHRTYAAVTSSGGTDGFRVAVTNLDDSNAADVYATFHVED